MLLCALLFSMHSYIIMSLDIFGVHINVIG